MDRGMDFLISQVNNAVMQHETFVKNLVDHESQAEDPRFRDLCTKYIPVMQGHQRMLEDYQREIGAEAGTAKKAIGKAFKKPGREKAWSRALEEGWSVRLVYMRLFVPVLLLLSRLFE